MWQNQRLAKCQTANLQAESTEASETSILSCKYTRICFQFSVISFYAPVMTLGTACMPSLPSMGVVVSGMWAIKDAYY